MIDRSILKKYDALKDEQRDIERRIENLRREMSHLLTLQVSDTVKGTREDGTYGPIKIKGVPMPEYDSKKAKLKERTRRYMDIKTELDGMISDIETFITTIDEPTIRTILRLKYIDGKTWRDIGRRYGKHHQWAANKLDRYFAENTCNEENEDIK